MLIPAIIPGQLSVLVTWIREREATRTKNDSCWC